MPPQSQSSRRKPIIQPTAEHTSASSAAEGVTNTSPPSEEEVYHQIKKVFVLKKISFNTKKTQKAKTSTQQTDANQPGDSSSRNHEDKEVTNPPHTSKKRRHHHKEHNSEEPNVYDLLHTLSRVKPPEELTEDSHDSGAPRQTRRHKRRKRAEKDTPYKTSPEHEVALQKENVTSSVFGNARSFVQNDLESESRYPILLMPNGKINTDPYPNKEKQNRHHFLSSESDSSSNRKPLPPQLPVPPPPLIQNFYHQRSISSYPPSSTEQTLLDSAAVFKNNNPTIASTESYTYKDSQSASLAVPTSPAMSPFPIPPHSAQQSQPQNHSRVNLRPNRFHSLDNNQKSNMLVSESPNSRQLYRESSSSATTLTNAAPVVEIPRSPKSSSNTSNKIHSRSSPLRNHQTSHHTLPPPLLFTSAHPSNSRTHYSSTEKTSTSVPALKDLPSLTFDSPLHSSHS